MSQKTKKNIVIVGGGITGLSSAYIAMKNGYNVTILESSEKVGGLLNSFKIGNTQLERFYHHFFTHDKELLWILEELNLKDKILFKKTSMGIFTNGAVYKFNSPLDLFKFKPFNLIDIFRFGLTIVYLALFSDWKKMEGFPAIKWFERYSGKKVTNIIWRPLIEGKFGPYTKILPISWMVGRLSQRFRSRESGDEKLGYLKGSFQVLVDALVKKLEKKGVRFEKNFLVDEVIVSKDRIVSVKGGGRVILGDVFLFCTPLNVTEKLIKIDNKYFNSLKKIEYFGAVCVILELKNSLTDFYWLNIADENLSFVGIIEQTNFEDKKTYNNSHIVYLTKYFDNESFYAKAKDSEIEKLMISDIVKIKPNFDKSDILSVRTFRSKTAAVVCDLNFSQKIPTYKTPIDNMYIASMVHVYPDERSANNSIRVAKYVCKDMGMDVSFIPEGNSLSGKTGLKC